MHYDMWMLVTGILCCVLSGRVWCKLCLVLSVQCTVIIIFIFSGL